MAKRALSTKPLVSIILPAYNAEASIVDTLSALQNQSYSNLEIICINDGSIDRTGEILEQAKKTNKALTVVHTINQGAYKARIEGIKKAKGEYICFCDADDIPAPFFIEKLENQAFLSSADMVVCAYNRIIDGGKTSLEMKWGEPFLRTTSEDSGWIASINTSLWNKLIKSSIAKMHIELANPPRIMEDALFLLSIYPQVKSIAFIPEPLYNYKMQPSASMTHLDSLEIENLLEAWRLTRLHALSINSDFASIFDWAAFIHLGVSATFSLVSSRNATKKNLEAIKKSLYSDFPCSICSKYATLSYARSHSDIGYMPFCAATAYRLGFLDKMMRAYAYLEKRTSLLSRW